MPALPLFPSAAPSAAPSALLSVLALALVLATGQAVRASDPPPAAAQPETIAGQPVVEIVAGFHHSCARVQSGTVWCWGRNQFGQLGNGTTTDSPRPVRVQGLTGAIQIALGREHSCALRSTGRIFCWGRGDDGQLGNNTRSNSPTPVLVRTLTDATRITAGGWHSCALRPNGRAFCWGWNASGQLGDGTNTRRLTPVRVAGSWGTQAIQIGAGARHSCLLRSTGRVACWGEDYYGQLGNGDPTTNQSLPGPVSGLSSVSQLATGLYHTCAIRTNGNTFCWGWNGYGGLGDGTTVNRTAPVRVRDLTGIARITTGGWDGHTCAIRDSGRIFCWGWNAFGTLGDGTTTTRLSPQRVIGLTGMTGVSAGGYHSCALQSDGRAYCWGANNFGQLGDGTTTQRLSPVRVAN
jgi:alpha-tubulin suppressor-like RCC1 family protein